MNRKRHVSQDICKYDEEAVAKQLERSRAAIASAMREYRMKTGLSRVEFAKRVHLAASMIFRVEHAEANISIRSLAKIGSCIGFHIEIVKDEQEQAEETA